MRSKRFLVRLTIVIATIVAATIAVAVLTGARTAGPAPTPLACDQVKLESPEGRGSLAAPTPEEAALGTEWLDVLEIPEAARRMEQEGATPENGIIPIPATGDVDGGTEPASDTTQRYRVVVRSEAVAEIVTVRGEDGTFYVGAVEHC